MTGRLSTHVLDTVKGVGAAGIVVDLHSVRGGERHAVTSATTNVEGRPDQPLLSGAIVPGVYELTFHAGEYFRRSGVTLSNPPFLDVIVIRIGLSDPDGHYHVPLLLSPYGYSTYRGT
jgi:5-hydroxyisourate hydrolase